MSGGWVEGGGYWKKTSPFATRSGTVMIPEEAAESTDSPFGLVALLGGGLVGGGFFNHLFDARNDGICAFADFRVGINRLDVFE